MHFQSGAVHAVGGAVLRASLRLKLRLDSLLMSNRWTVPEAWRNTGKASANTKDRFEETESAIV